MDEQEEDLGSFSSFDDDDDDNDDGAASSNFMISSSSSTDFVDDATSASSNGDLEEEDGSTLFEMSDLFAHLPFKSGLSKHFQGKSQSFSSLSNVKILEDLAKPERSYKKKLKSSKNYEGVLLDSNKALSCAKAITKKSSRGSFSALTLRRKGFFGNSKLPFPSLRSSEDCSGQALLFA